MSGNTSTTPVSSNFSIALHTVYGFLATLLVPLLVAKYLGSDSNAIEENKAIILFFLTTLSIYAIAYVGLTILGDDVIIFSQFLRIIFHTSGVISLELLFLALQYNRWFIFINLLLILFVVALFSCFNYGSLILDIVLVRKCITRNIVEEGVSGIQMVDIESQTRNRVEEEVSGVQMVDIESQTPNIVEEGVSGVQMVDIKSLAVIPVDRESARKENERSGFM